MGSFLAGSAGRKGQKYHERDGLAARIAMRHSGAAFAGLGQCDRNGLADRFLFGARMAGAYRAILLPFIDQCLDIAADHRPA